VRRCWQGRACPCPALSVVNGREREPRSITMKIKHHAAAKRRLSRLVSTLLLLAAGFFMFSFGSTGSTTGTASVSVQHSFTQRWNPTRVPAGVDFVGDQACAECHQSKVTSQRQTSMGMAMEPVEDSVILSTHPALTFQKGSYSYSITRNGKQSFYAVTDGKETISLPIQFAFGQGKAGQTYVLQYEGAYFESLVSYYDELKGLDFTIGAPRGVPTSLLGALGRRLSKSETLNCFRCHSTGGINGDQLQLEKLTPGIIATRAPTNAMTPTMSGGSQVTANRLTIPGTGPTTRPRH